MKDGDGAIAVATDPYCGLDVVRPVPIGGNLYSKMGPGSHFTDPKKVNPAPFWAGFLVGPPSEGAGAVGWGIWSGKSYPHYLWNLAVCRNCEPHCSQNRFSLMVYSPSQRCEPGAPTAGWLAWPGHGLTSAGRHHQLR